MIAPSLYPSSADYYCTFSDETHLIGSPLVIENIEKVVAAAMISPNQSWYHMHFSSSYPGCIEIACDREGSKFFKIDPQICKDWLDSETGTKNGRLEIADIFLEAIAKQSQSHSQSSHIARSYTAIPVKEGSTFLSKLDRAMTKGMTGYALVENKQRATLSLTISYASISPPRLKKFLKIVEGSFVSPNFTLYIGNHKMPELEEITFLMLRILSKTANVERTEPNIQAKKIIFSIVNPGTVYILHSNRSSIFFRIPFIKAIFLNFSQDMHPSEKFDTLTARIRQLALLPLKEVDKELIGLPYQVSPQFPTFTRYTRSTNYVDRFFEHTPSKNLTQIAKTKCVDDIYGCETPEGKFHIRITLRDYCTAIRLKRVWSSIENCFT